MQVPEARTMHAWRVALVLLLLLSGIRPASALDRTKTIAQYGHDVWLRQNGLPANAINVALQTRDGYLWLGTAAGLFRFDGAKFALIRTDPTSLENRESISTLFEGRDGALWIGTSFSQLCRLKDGIITRFGEQEGINSRNILALIQTRAGELLLGTSYGLYRSAADRFVSVPISPMYVTGVAEDGKGNIWVGTHEGIRVYTNNRLSRSFPVIIRGQPRPVTTVYADHQGGIWVGTYEGLAHWSDRNVQTYSLGEGLTDARITAICEDRQGNLWVGTNRGGVNRLTEGKWTSFTVLDGLTNNHVLSIAEDREGSLWVCTLDGLNRFKDVNITPYTSKEGLSSDYISSILETPDGSLYFLSPETSVITQMRGKALRHFSSPVGPAFISHDGTVWIGQNGSLTKLKSDHLQIYGRQAGIPGKWISAITEDSESLILYINDVGIRRFSNGRVAPYLLGNGEQYPSQEYVSSFYTDSAGTLWIGSTRGLVRIQHGETRLFGPPDGMADYWISSIFDDRRGSLWISSPHAGLTRYHEGKFTVFNAKHGLFTDEIYMVLGDDEGNLWLTSPRGIGRLFRSELDAVERGEASSFHTEVFVTADGMKTDECFGNWFPSGWRAHDGRLWFATTKGAVVVDPRTIRRNTLPPPVLIENIVAGGETFPAGTPQQFSPGTEKFEFHYTALSLLVPERVLFKCKLEGYDREWVDAGTRRVAYYTNLPPGKYRFRVIACNNDGIWDDAGAGVEFTLAPHFTETPWFEGLVLLGVALLIGLLYKLRVRHLQTREAQLESLVQLRTDELQAQRSFLRKIIDLNPSFIFAKDSEGRFTLANRALAEAYGATVEALIGRTDADLGARKEEADKTRQDDREVLESGLEKFIPEDQFTGRDGRPHWMQVIKIPFTSGRDERQQMLGVSTDITRRKEAEERLRASVHEKEVLLREIHHRVKNNLQVVSSLLNLQAAQMEDEKARLALAECRNRVRSMALIHENLYRTENLASINFGEYLRTVTSELVRSFGRDGIETSFHLEPILLSVDTAIPCGLIINELVTNALRHGFAGKPGGNISVTLRRVGEGGAELCVRDDGAGFKPPADLHSVNSMGTTLVLSLADQIGGNVSVASAPGQGTCVCINFHTNGR